LAGGGRGEPRISRWTGSAGRWTIYSPWRAPNDSIILESRCQPCSISWWWRCGRLRENTAGPKRRLGGNGGLAGTVARAAAAARRSAGTTRSRGGGRRVPRPVGRTGRNPGLAGWLERRPQLGYDVFSRGQLEIFGNSVEAGQAIDVVEFIWERLALFDDETAADTANVYRPLPFELYQVAEAPDRIMRLLAEAPDGAPFERFLPAPPEIADSESDRALRLRLGPAR
jgi:hypothetical protein